MNYRKFIGRACAVEYVDSKYLSYLKWIDGGCPVNIIEGTVENGTNGTLVIRTKDNYIIRLDDEYIKLFVCKGDVNEN